MGSCPDDSAGRAVTPSTLPAWLSAAPPDPEPETGRALVSFPFVFENLMGQIARGVTLRTALRERLPDAHYEAFMRWVMRDPDRKRRYYETLEIASETTSSDMLSIADGLDPDAPPETVHLARLKIDTRRFLIGVWNRARFGEVKQIDLGMQINLRATLEHAQARVIAGEVVRDAE